MTESSNIALYDTHLHAVGADVDRYPRRDSGLANGPWWLAGEPVDAGHVAAQLELAGVDRGVLVHASGPYGVDNRYVVDAVAGQKRFVGASTIAPSPTAAAELAVFSDRFVATRVFHVGPADDPPTWLDTADGDRLIDAAADRGLVVLLCVQAHDLGRVAHQLRRRPDIAFVLDHCGFADLGGSAPFTAAQPLWNLAQHPNLTVKLTPTTLAHCADPGVAGAEVLGALVDRFGADRVVWGSDYPQHRHTRAGRPADYAGLVAEVKAWTEPLALADQAAVRAGNAIRLFGV